MSVMQMYQRYGGLYQGQPLSDDEQKYDDTCREIDKKEVEIGDKSMALFKAHEFLWFSGFVNKTFFGPKQDRLDKHLKSLTELLDILNQRENEK